MKMFIIYIKLNYNNWNIFNNNKKSKLSLETNCIWVAIKLNPNIPGLSVVLCDSFYSFKTIKLFLLAYHVEVIELLSNEDLICKT